MQDVYPIYKPVGRTPLYMVNEFKRDNPQLADEPVSYAGRLDPMAEGLLLLLVGETNKKRKAFEGLDKTYEFSVVFGIATDSYDLLGLPVLHQQQTLSNEQIKMLDDAIRSRHGTYEQTYPPYSSKTVKGKPLFFYARTNTLSTITLPSKHVTIYSLCRTRTKTLSAPSLLKRIMKILPVVSGDFRQEEIRDAWRQLLSPLDRSIVLTEISFLLHCSSGTYVRSLANDIGNTIGSRAVVSSLKRLSVGTFSL